MIRKRLETKAIREMKKMKIERISNLEREAVLDVLETNFRSSSGSKYMTLLENEFTKKSCCEDDIQLFQNHEPQKIDQENFLLYDCQIHSVCPKVSPIRPSQDMSTIEQHP